MRSLRRRRRALRRLGSPLLLATIMAALLACAPGASGATRAATSAPAWDPTSTVIAPGVTVGGIAVGGLDETSALAAVRAAWTQPGVAVRLVGKTFTATAQTLGQLVLAAPAVHTAMGVGRPGGPAVPATGSTYEVSLRVEINANDLAHWITKTAAIVDRAPVDASYVLVHKRPKITREREGWAVDQSALRVAISAALLKVGTPAGSSAAATQASIAARTIAASDTLVLVDARHPRMRARNLPKVIVIDRTNHRLFLYSPRRLVHSWPVATGRSAYPTPLGRFTIVDKQKNPTWTPPNSAWAQGESAIGPGAGNPLGTRWMGLSAGGIGIHGTPNPGSVGYSASHGCIRMRIPDVERLFTQVTVGTPVHIVA